MPIFEEEAEKMKQKQKNGLPANDETKNKGSITIYFVCRQVSVKSREHARQNLERRYGWHWTKI